MRLLLPLMIVVVLLSPVYAATIVFENFEGAPVGTSVNGYNGWTGDDNVVICSDTIDQGLSAEFVEGDSVWPIMSKAITYTPASGDYYEFGAKLYAPGEGGDYAQVGLYTEEPYAIAKAMLGYGTLSFFMQTVAESEAYPPYGVTLNLAITPQPEQPVDVRMVFNDGRTDCYYRLNGETGWTEAGGVDYGDIALYSVVQLAGHGSWAGNVDTVALLVNEEYIPSQEIPGDANADGVVNEDDAMKLAANWLYGPYASWGMGDFNSDGYVNDIDATILATNWTANDNTTVPEPGAIAVFSGMLLMLILRKQK